MLELILSIIILILTVAFVLGCVYGAGCVAYYVALLIAEAVGAPFIAKLGMMLIIFVFILSVITPNNPKSN